MINEKTFPIRARWILKPHGGLGFTVLPAFLYVGLQSHVSVRLIFELLVVYLVVLALLAVPFRLLQRANFHYQLDDDYITFRQGIINKAERHLPYAVVQNLLLKQGLIDRLLGLTTLQVQNASQGAGAPLQASTKGYGVDTLGFRGNNANVPGLTPSDAENLRREILDRVISHPLRDSRSGL